MIKLSKIKTGKYTLLFQLGQYCLAVLTLLVLIVVVWQTIEVIQKYCRTQEISKSWAQIRTNDIAEALDQELQQMQIAAKALAANISQQSLNGELQQKNIEASLKKSVHNQLYHHSQFSTIGVAFNTYQLPSLRLYAPFVFNDGRSEIFRIDHDFDYLNPPIYSAHEKHQARTQVETESWYCQALSRPPFWMPPRYDLALERYTLQYTHSINIAANAQQQVSDKSTSDQPTPDNRDAPVISQTESTCKHTQSSKQGQTEKPIGLVYVEISFNWLRTHIENFDIGDNGYAILVNNNNQILYHGLKGSRELIDDLMSQKNFHQVSKNGSFEHNALTGEKAWYHTKTLNANGWRLITMINPTHTNKQLFDNTREEQLLTKSDGIVLIFELVILFTLLYVWFILLHGDLSVYSAWRHSTLLSVLFLLGTISVWLCEYHAKTPALDNSVVLSNRAIVDQFKRDYAIESLKERKQPPIYIPTGMFIQSLEFISATNVTLTGYIWQRYPIDEQHKIDHSVIFPEAIETNITPAYERQQGNEIVKGWYFEVTLRERFNYNTFPFDRQSVWIRLWHKDFGRNIVQVPDFTAYDSLNPSALPGIEKDFVISGWSLNRTFYDIRINSYNSDFGKEYFTSRDKMPELYFNIELNRRFLNPFIAHLFPLAVILLMLFAIVITISRQEKKKDLFGFNASTVVATCSALFFVILIAHVQLRGELSANSIVYLEYFYLLSYIVILLITINSILFTSEVPLKVIQYKP